MVWQKYYVFQGLRTPQKKKHIYLKITKCSANEPFHPWKKFWVISSRSNTLWLYSYLDIHLSDVQPIQFCLFSYVIIFNTTHRQWRGCRPARWPAPRASAPWVWGSPPCRCCPVTHTACTCGRRSAPPAAGWPWCSPRAPRSAPGWQRCKRRPAVTCNTTVWGCGQWTSNVWQTGRYRSSRSVGLYKWL